MAKFGKKIVEGLSVDVKEGRFERALRQFVKKVNNSGILREVRERQYFEKPSVVKRKLKKAAIKRWQKAEADRNRPFQSE